MIVAQRIHVWYIYLHLVDFYGKLVGKYTIHGSSGLMNIQGLLFDSKGFANCSHGFFDGFFTAQHIHQPIAWEPMIFVELGGGFGYGLPR